MFSFVKNKHYPNIILRNGSDGCHEPYGYKRPEKYVLPDENWIGCSFWNWYQAYFFWLRIHLLQLFRYKAPIYEYVRILVLKFKFFWGLPT